MNAPGWSTHRLIDAVRPRDGSAEFAVLVRRRPRYSAGVLALDDRSPQITNRDRPNLSRSSGPGEIGVSADTSANYQARSLPLMGPPVLRPFDRVGSSVVAGSGPGLGTSFGDLASVRAMGTGKPGIVVGFDTEFTTVDGARVINSYQFAAPDPLNPSVMVEVIIVPLTGERVSLHSALWTVVEAAELQRSPLVPEEVGPRGVPREQFWTGDPEQRRETLARLRVPLVLACHYGSADLTTFRVDGRSGDVDHLTRLTSAAGGLVTLRPFRMQRGNANGSFWQSMSVTVRDTMSHAPAGQQRLADLGAACGVPKLDVPDGWIERMGEYRDTNLADFLEYGINDAVIVVEYLARLWGDGVVPPVTLSGGAASALVSTGSAYFGVGSPKDFRRMFAGLVDEKGGLDVVEEGDKLTFYAKHGRNPLDGAAAQVMSAFASAYHGGLNSCPMPGYYPTATLDLDALNAYPTAMASVPDLDWEAGCIEEVVHERPLTLDDLSGPTTPFAGFVSFVFPHDVHFPCIPIVADGTLVYPRTSDGVAGTWVCGPEVHLAMMLGAEVFCQIGYIGRVLARSDGSPSLSLRDGVKQLIDDRNTAKERFGPGSIEERTLKTAVNSVYGKTAQDVAEQRAWNAYAQGMDAVGGSGITSPYHAAVTTSLVRAQLHAVMNQISNSGGNVFSVTTDGLITDTPLAEVEAFDMFGLGTVLREAREALTGAPAIWEVKHIQGDLVNFTTRGNVSLEPGGVCAHNGLKAPKDVESDSAEDRELLLRAVVTREARIPNGYTRFPSFRELSRSDDRRDFIPFQVERSLSMDYDLKRRPVMSSIEPRMVPLPDGTSHEMATFTTEPWESVADCLRAREIAREMAKSGCLRTVNEWTDWDIRFVHGRGRRIVTKDRTVLMSIVIAHRLGVVEVPTLSDRALSVSQRLEWLEAWGLGTVSRSDWDNARRPERSSQMLPLDSLEPHLSRMVSMPSGLHPNRYRPAA